MLLELFLDCLEVGYCYRIAPIIVSSIMTSKGLFSTPVMQILFVTDVEGALPILKLVGLYSPPIPLLGGFCPFDLFSITDGVTTDLIFILFLGAIGPADDLYSNISRKLFLKRSKSASSPSSNASK